MSDTESLDEARRLSGQTVFIRYVLFAVVAGFANLAAQEAVVRVMPTLPLMVAILIGTVVGFVSKYILDKKWIFLDPYEGHGTEARKVMIYGSSSVATTLLFWAAELLFWHVTGSVEGKYTGAVLGLSLGNFVKYRLDRYFVFNRASYRG